jgi:hypothetical protein
MGVISVGASLGVREARAPAPAAQAPISSSSTRRSSTASSASSAAATSRKKSSRKRPAGTSAKKRAANAATSSTAAVRRSPSPNYVTRDAPPPPKVMGVTPSVSMVINGKKPIARMVHVRTTMDPARLAPHVIGVNGGKLNAIMSRARCSISYRKTQGADEKKEDAFSMAFMIAASTAKRVEDGVQLLQAVVESTEQQIRKYQSSGGNAEQVELPGQEQEMQTEQVVVDVDAQTELQQQNDAKRNSEERQAQTRIQGQVEVPETPMQQVSEYTATTGRSRSQSAHREQTPQQNRHAKREWLQQNLAISTACLIY